MYVNYSHSSITLFCSPILLIPSSSSLYLHVFSRDSMSLTEIAYRLMCES